MVAPGGRFLCLEFSPPWAPVRPCYNLFSFAVIPRLGALVAAEIIAVLWTGFPSVPSHAAAAVATDVSNTKELGKLLYSAYLFPVEIAAVILLVAMVTAIALTLRARKDSKAINPGDQVRVRANDRLVVLPMTATQKSAPAVEAAAAEEAKP